MALKGITVLELAGLAPAPFCGLVLADHGATVVRVDRAAHAANPAGNAAVVQDSLSRGKRSIALNLKTKQGRQALLTLTRQADVLIEPFRPGVMERLGLDMHTLQTANPKLIIARLSGYGQPPSPSTPPNAAAAATATATAPHYTFRAGHDINYVAQSGLLATFRRGRSLPLFPGNVLADFAGGGLMCAMGIMLALFERVTSGKGQIIDASLTDGTAYLSCFLHRMRAAGMWNAPAGHNLLDSGAPFYDVYETKDGRHMAVGALEPQFYALLLQGLGLDHDQELPAQHDVAQWPVLRAAFTLAFKSRTRAAWERVFTKLDACVSPVLTPEEVATDAHNAARGIFVERRRPKEDSSQATTCSVEPAPAPRLSRTQPSAHAHLSLPRSGEHTVTVLREFGFPQTAIHRLLQRGDAFQLEEEMATGGAAIAADATQQQQRVSRL